MAKKTSPNIKAEENANKKTDTSVKVAIIGLIGTVATTLIIYVLAPFILGSGKPPLENSAISTETNPGISTVLTSGSILTTNPTPIFGPKEGGLRHNNDIAFEWRLAGLSVKNFIVDITFINPYSASEYRWTEGLAFRNSHAKDIMLTISSLSQWQIGARLPEWKELFFGDIDRTFLNFEKGEFNRIRVIAYENSGCFYLNNHFIAELDLSDLNQPGDIAATTATFPQSEQSGEITDYKDFTIYRLNSFSVCP
jgi:hypothetical protein